MILLCLARSTLVLGFFLKHSWCGVESRAREGGIDADDGDDVVVVVHELGMSRYNWAGHVVDTDCIVISLVRCSLVFSTLSLPLFQADRNLVGFEFRGCHLIFHVSFAEYVV
ncbi:hypothetical protein KC19_VG332800 [Ceratodon purpureus]|uniref:Secreted protein n=1 Tax=Ceratodon purpureus TaxID=3225 RepID=A0A8T0HWY1_CERPU|nr:hypothetical protein KC19_VG332800 [Ceratodon purpureus]